MVPLNDDLLRATRKFDASGRPMTRATAHRLTYSNRQKSASHRVSSDPWVSPSRIVRSALASFTAMKRPGLS